MTTSYENGVAAMLAEIDAPVAAFFSSCTDCGLCAEACEFFTETGEARFAPTRKMEPMKQLWWREFTLSGRLADLFGLAPAPTRVDFEKWQELVYDSCTLCGRCAMVCPEGCDLPYMIIKMREGLSAAGLAPEDHVAAARRHLTKGSPMGIRPQTIRAVVEEQSREVGIPITVDQPRVDYMVVLSAMEVMGFPEILGALARLFKQAGVSWTVSTSAYEATNIGYQMGAHEIARALVERVVTTAETLKVGAILSPECGHAYQALRWQGPELIGRPYDCEVVHILELLDRLVGEGRLRLRGGYPKRITYHDPCQISRRGGLDDTARRLLDAVAEDFVDCRDHGAMNWCCGGGGGVAGIERAEGLRLKAFGPKKRQIEAVQPEALVTACANCRNVLEEAIDHHEMDLPVIGLTELVAQYLDEETHLDEETQKTVRDGNEGKAIRLPAGPHAMAREKERVIQ